MKKKERDEIFLKMDSLLGRAVICQGVTKSWLEEATALLERIRKP
jgi:hypothetical protein